MLVFPIEGLLDQERCYKWLVGVLHPEGMACPEGHGLPPDQQPHDRHRAPILDYRCRQCGAVFNVFSGTIWSGTRYTCCQIVLIIRGIAQGVPTAHLAKELGVDESNLRHIRHQLQGLIEQALPKTKLSDREVEADELYQNAGEKGRPHRNPQDPPRCRAKAQICDLPCFGCYVKSARVWRNWLGLGAAIPYQLKLSPLAP